MKRRAAVVALTLVLFTLPALAQEVLHVKRVSAPPTVDGQMESVWDSAPSTVVNVTRIPEAVVAINREEQRGKYAKNWQKSKYTQVSEVELKAVYTEDEIFFLARWKDTTRDDQHKPWKWEGDKKTGEYVSGKEREDRIAFRFPINGTFTASMLDPVDAVVDVWQWKAARTNPLGIAHDKSHRYSRTEPKGTFSTHYAPDGSETYVSRPGDGGVSPYETNRIDLFTHQGGSVPHYLPKMPTDEDASDVKAKGIWKSEMWTVEIGRRLDTGHGETDTVFDPARETAMTVAVFDHVGDHFHAVSDVIRVVFGGRPSL